jgi:hypothetical protein
MAVALVVAELPAPLRRSDSLLGGLHLTCVAVDDSGAVAHAR